MIPFHKAVGRNKEDNALTLASIVLRAFSEYYLYNDVRSFSHIWLFSVEKNLRIMSLIYSWISSPYVILKCI